jgi:NTE family protein
MKKIPFECIALLLQGGGALGAYQAGVYQALFEANLAPNWVAGISIGAINGAIIAGNAPEQRVDKLREFWESVTTDTFQYTPDIFKSLMTSNEPERKWLSQMSALRSIFFGIPGFFTPHMLPWLEPKGSKKAISFCDIAPLKSTLEKLIDFDRLNNCEIYFKVGATHVASGDFVNFNNQDTKIGPQHIMASGALPPGFPPVEVDGEYYWDGGLISNTPLQWVFENKNYRDTLIFQVDLWSADGEFPQNMAQMMTRCKDIQYSSRTRANTDRFQETHALRHAIATMLEDMPEALKNRPEMKLLKANADSKVYNIVHLIYHNKAYEGYTKDFEFSRLSMEAHWKSGYEDTIHTLKHPEVLQPPHNKEGIAVFDFSKEDAPKEKLARRA